LGQTENTTISGTLTTLSSSTCADANGSAPLKAQTAPGASFDQKLQLLAGQDALPELMMAPGTPSLMKQLISANQVVDLSPELDRLGVADQILPAAKSTLQALYGSQDLYALPTEFNIEGIWYNKKIFSDNGISAPGTWDELVAAVTKLKAAGIQPIAADGKDGWNITRYIGNYIFRSLGADALQKVADGQAKLTDADYVKGAQAVADLGAAGAFGDAVGSIDYNTTLNLFLTGKAAMVYMGSWALSNFNDTKQNTIGVDNIGFMPFPAVTGGTGSIDDYPSNVGVPITFGTKGYGTNSAAWVKCIAEGYGDAVFKDSGVISGFKTDAGKSSSPVTAMTQDNIAKAKSSVLWFEALFSPKGTTLSQQDAAALATGQMSPADFMAAVQAANG